MSTNTQLVEDLKQHFLNDLSEWLGSDIPEEGDEDYDTWQSRLDEIESIITLDDALVYAEAYVGDLEEFRKAWGLTG